jgi:hypothetical protein
MPRYIISWLKPKANRFLFLSPPHPSAAAAFASIALDLLLLAYIGSQPL